MTPMPSRVRNGEREAARYGRFRWAAKSSTDPEKSIEMAADYFLQAENFSPAQVFEKQAAAVLSGEPLARSQNRAVG